MKLLFTIVAFTGIFFSSGSNYVDIPKVELTKTNTNFLLKYIENRLQVFHDSIPAYQLGVKVNGKIINPYGGSFTHKPKLEDTVLFTVVHKNTGKLLFKREFLCIYKSKMSEFINSSNFGNDASFNFILNRDAQRFLKKGEASFYEIHSDNVILKELEFVGTNASVKWVNDSTISVLAAEEGKSTLIINYRGGFVTKKEFPVKA